MGSNQVAREGAGAVARSVLPSPTPDEAAMERAYKPDCDSCGVCVREHSDGTFRRRVPRGTRDARRRAMGGAMAAARVRPSRALRATADPRRPTSRRAADSQDSRFPVRQVAARLPATAPRTRATDPISDSPVVGRFPAPAAADGPRVMPETRCVSKNWGWWPGAESNHRHADFQSRAEI